MMMALIVIIVYLWNFIGDDRDADDSVYVKGCVTGFVYGNNADDNGDNKAIII